MRRPSSIGAVVLAVVAVVALAVLQQLGGDAGDDAVTGSSSTASSYAGTSDGPSGPSSSSGSRGQTGTDPESGLPWIAESALPTQARDTLQRIDRGGPFPYPGKDGSTFGNYEGLLPEESRGYYAEYTVPTPGEDDRGARRIITGDGGEYYWTADHYESFSRIDRDGS